MHDYTDSLVAAAVDLSRPAAPQGLALARFFTRSNYWEAVQRGPHLAHPKRNPNHWVGPRAAS